MLFYWSIKFKQQYGTNANPTEIQERTSEATLAVNRAIRYQGWRSISKAYFLARCEEYGVEASEAEKLIRMLKVWGTQIHKFLHLGLMKLLKLSTEGSLEARQEIIQNNVTNCYEAGIVLKKFKATKKNRQREDVCKRKQIGGKPVLRIELTKYETLLKFEQLLEKSNNSINWFMQNLLHLHELDLKQQAEMQAWIEEQEESDD